MTPVMVSRVPVAALKVVPPVPMLVAPKVTPAVPLATFAPLAILSV